MKQNHLPSFLDRDEKIRWIEEIIHEFEAGRASVEQITALRALLLEDAEARQIYQEANHLTAMLEAVKMPVISELQKTSLFRKVAWLSGATAALLALGIWLVSNPKGALPQEPKKPYLATLSASNEAVWEGPAADKGQFLEGKFKLKSGIARLKFQNDARFVIEGPCHFEIIDGNTIELESGKLWGHCPPSARGFEVLAPGGHRIIDLGTEFGVAAETTGAVDVHVFDGEVEVTPNSQEKHALGAGSALKLAPGEDPFALAADSDRFMDSNQLQRDLYELYHDELVKRDDLLAYYDFDTSRIQNHTLKDEGPSRIDGSIRGALPVIGRVAGKSALLFEHPSDAVKLDLSHIDLAEQMTLSMWIKPTEISKSHIALFNTDAYDPGAIHFQFLNDGKLSSSIEGIGGYVSAPGMVKKDVWQLVAVTWDFTTGKARFFLNGEPLMTEKRKNLVVIEGATPNFGSCQIGAWGMPTYGHNRNFTGRIDEITLFSRILSHGEMEELFERSRP